MSEGNPPANASIGRFELSSKLGRGAFGEVHLATDLELQRLVALKIPREGSFQSQQEAERFVREARAAAGLQHPNICPVHDVLKHDGVPVIVMGYIKGKRLDEIISRSQLSQRKIVALIGKLATALQYAHNQGVVHRDLKPANIIIEQDRKEPVIMDFGLARVGAAEDSELTRTGQLLGSPAYMSPEQANADLKAIGPASDVYSLGVILYELLSGRRPFDGSVGDVLAAILYAEPRKPSEYRADIAPGLERICMRAIAKERDKRYPCMDKFARDLSRWLKSASSTDASHSRKSVSDSVANGSPSVDTRRDRKVRSDAMVSPSQTTRLSRKVILCSTAAILLLVGTAVTLFRAGAANNVSTQDDEDTFAKQSLPEVQANESPAKVKTDPVPKPIRVEVNELHSIQSDPKRVSDIAIHPSGQFIAAANADRTVKVWDVNTGDLIKSLTGFQDEAICVAYSEDGFTLITGDSNRGKSQSGTVTGWETDSWKKKFTFTDTKAIRSVEFADDDQRVFVALGSSMDERQLKRMEESRSRVRQRPGGNSKFSPRAQQQRGNAQGTMFFKRWHWGGLIVWDVATQTIIGYPDINTSRVLEVSASADGTVIATCGYRGELNIRNGLDGEIVALLSEQLLSEPDYDVNAVRVSDDGSMIVAAVPNGFSVYSTTDREELRRIKTKADVRSLAISSDSRLIAVGFDKGPVEIWDSLAGVRLAELEVSWNTTSDLEFRSDDYLLAASGGDVAGDIRIWSIRLTHRPDREAVESVFNTTEPPVDEVTG